MILRKRAAELLAQNSGADAVLAALSNAPWELALSIAGALAKTDAGCTALLDAIDAGKASPRLLVNKAVAGPLTSRPKPVRDRATALTKVLPPEDARLDKVIAERADAFRKARPDPAHGAQVFQQTCAVCHRFRNAGGNVGPNLDGVVARGVARLVEDILDPNRNVDPGFRQAIIETRDGQMFAGVNVREQGDAVLLTDATGNDISVPKTAIKTRTQTQLSLMPPAFETQIPPGDFNDLLAFLLGGK
jgi:putative heme-binding domain-containing protein